MERLNSDQDVELFLYQVRLILLCMRNTHCWGMDYFPSTVAATWTSPRKNCPILAAFAVSCIKGRKSSLREEQNLARQNYNQRLYQLVTATVDELNALGSGQNRAGNCPEFITWATICGDPGCYGTLCFHIALEQTMQCCGPCLETRKAAGMVEMFIDDRWQTCSLVSHFGAEGKKRISRYQVKNMDPTNQILKHGRLRRVLQRRWL